MREIPLEGGRVTEGVVRVGNTVRRPHGPNSAFIEALLVHLQVEGFDAVPRFLGTDEEGRDVFGYLAGEVPHELDAELSDGTLVQAARLIRRFHDATAGSGLAGSEEVVCHNDLSPCNFVFARGEPTGIIDFDMAAPGRRLADLGYAIFLWLNLGTDGHGAAEQARRIELFSTAYGIETDNGIMDAITEAVGSTVHRLRAEGRPGDEWWEAQRHWIDRHRSELVPGRS